MKTLPFFRFILKSVPNNHDATKTTVMENQDDLRKKALFTALPPSFPLFMLILVFLFVQTIKSKGETVVLKGGTTAEKLQSESGNSDSGKKYYIDFVNNTGHPICDMRITMNSSGTIINSCHVFEDKKVIGFNAPNNIGTHITFSEPVPQGGKFSVKLWVDKANTKATITPTDSLGADMMLNTNYNNNSKLDNPRPTALYGGKIKIKFAASNFPSLDYVDSTGQEIWDFWIDSVKTAGADNNKVKIDSVFVNGIKVKNDQGVYESGVYKTHVILPAGIAPGEKYTVTIKCNGNAKAVTCQIIPTNKDTADIISKMVPVIPNHLNNPKTGLRTIFYDDQGPLNNKISSKRPSIMYDNKTNTVICDLWAAIPNGSGSNNPKIVKVLVNGEEWPVDTNAKSDTLVHLLGPAGKEIKKDTTFSVTLVLENGSVTEMTVTPTDSAHNIVTTAHLNGGNNNFSFDNRLRAFGSMGRSASLTAINESCSPISQLIFTSPDSGIHILSAGSSLPGYFDQPGQTFYFTPPVNQGLQLDLNYVINDLLPYAPDDTFPYTLISIYSQSNVAFDGYLVAQSPTCSTAVNGSIDLTVTAGVPPYWYQWSNGSTTEDLSMIGAGTYTVTVTSLTGCMIKTCEVQAGQPTLSMLSIDTWCSGGTDGEIIALHHGFAEPVMYLWSNGGTLQRITNLAPGNFNLIINDAAGCWLTGNAIIQSPAPLLISGYSTPASCANSNSGSINISTQNGAGIYTYRWNNGSTVEDPSMLTAGVYTLTVTDGYGCTASASFPVGQPAVLSISVSKVMVKCYGKSTGKATATVTGGNPSYSCLWSNGSTGNQATNLHAGTYTVTVTDASGCSKTKSTVITDNALIQISVIPISATEVTAGIAGGVPPYTYSWNTVPVQTTAVATGLMQGQNYTLTVKDNLQCSKSKMFIMGSLKLEGTDEHIPDFNIQVSPNPTSGIIHIEFPKSNEAQTRVMLTEITGRLVYVSTIAQGESNIIFDFRNEAKGIYVLKVIQGAHQQVKKLIIE